MSVSVKSDKRLTKTTIDIILVAAMFVFFAIIFFQALLLSKTAGLVPKLMSGVGMALCAIQMVADFRKRKLELSGEASVEEEKPAQLKWYYMLLILIAYIAGLYFIGFIPSALLFLLITPYIMQQKKIKLNIIVAIVATIVLYYVFVEIFYVRLPDGLILDYLF
jgi:hypothetical protein